MVDFPFDELSRSRATLENEARELESRIEVLTKKLNKCRDQIRAINTLLPIEQPQTTMSSVPGHTSLLPTDSGQQFTPTDAYWIPILEALEERGGRERSDVVLEIVGRKMASTLKPEDHEILPSGISVRWRNRAQWQRQNMVQQGLLTKNSPRGVWEIAPLGRQWLLAQKKKAS